MSARKGPADAGGDGGRERARAEGRRLGAALVAYVVVGLGMALGVALFEAGERVFSPEELASFDGAATPGKRYLAVLGEVFDVSDGDFYRDGGSGYGFFVGKDASRSFATGEFSGEARDDILDLNVSDIKSIVQWREFYREHPTYEYKGKVSGRYYDPLGQPTLEMEKIDVIMAEEADKDATRAAAKLKYPLCNSRWTKAQGTEVWCTNSLQTNYEARRLVPRLIFDPTTHTKRCGCVEYDEAVGSPDKFDEYEKCHARAQRCNFKRD